MKRPLLAAPLTGFTAHLLAPVISARVEALAADGRVHAALIAEARAFAAGARQAGAEWLAWREATSADGTSEVVVAEPVRGSWRDDEVTTAQAADLLGVTDRWIRHLIAAGALSGRRVGRVWHVDRAGIDIELERRRAR